MKQEDKKQLIVPFGKYKGKPIEKLLRDESYAKWLAGQDWFQQKFQSMYTLIIHNYHSEPVDTPEHNRMQVKFLKHAHALKLAFLASDKKLFQFNNKHFKQTVPTFLSKLKEQKVDLIEIIEKLKRMKGKKLLKITKIEFEQKELDVKYDVSYGYADLGVSEGTFQEAPTLFNNFWRNFIRLKMRIELKPSIGDNFPTVLRQMKSSGASILVIREYTGTGVSFNEFKQFFTSQGIKVFTEQEVEKVRLPVYDEQLEFDDRIFHV